MEHGHFRGIHERTEAFRIVETEDRTAHHSVVRYDQSETPKFEMSKFPFLHIMEIRHGQTLQVCQIHKTFGTNLKWKQEKQENKQFHTIKCRERRYLYHGPEASQTNIRKVTIISRQQRREQAHLRLINHEQEGQRYKTLRAQEQEQE